MTSKSWKVTAALFSASLVPSLLMLPAPAHAAAYSWNSTTGGNWTDTSATGWNTLSSYPSAVGDTATFSQNITGDTTVTIDTSSAIVGALTLTDATIANYNWIIGTLDASTNKLTFNNGASAATLTTTSSSTTGSHMISAPVVLSSDLIVKVSGSGSNNQLTLSGGVSGSKNVTMDGTSYGVLTLSTANASYTGTTTINAAASGNSTGALRLSNASALANSALVLNGNGGAVQNGAILQLRADADTTFSTASTTLMGTSTINVDQLSAGNTGKTLTLGPVSVGNVATNSNLYVSGANGYALSLGDITLSTTASRRLAVQPMSASVVLANVTAAAGVANIFQLDGTAASVVSGVISNGTSGGTVSLNKANSSTWTLNSANTFTGNTNISGGTLKLANALALQSSAVSVGATNGLAFADAIGTFTTGILSGAGSFSLTDTANSPITLRVGNDNATNFTAYSGVMSGSGGITKIGTGTELIGGASSNTYTGATTVTSGTIKLATSNALPVGTSLVVNGGYMDLNSFNQTIGQLSGASTGTVRNNAVNSTGTLTVTGTSQYDGVIANGQSSDRVMALVKSTGGTLTLTNANTYAGGTTISAGTLLVNNTIGSGVGTGSVSVAGTLGGSGRIGLGAGKMVTIASGGTLAPGNSPGTLTIVGTQTGTPLAGSATLNFVSGATYAVELDGLAAGTGYDSIDLTGNVDLGQATLGVSLGMTLAEGQVFTIIRNDQAEAVLSAFAGLAQDDLVPGIVSNGYGLKISYSGEAGAISGGNDVVLYSVAIPEPATTAMVSLGMAGLLMGRWRRR